MSENHKKETVLRESDWNKRKIIDMVDQISNVWILNEIIRFIENITK